MLATQLFSELRTHLPMVLKRNLAVSYVAAQKASDPIQQIFLDKLREYKAKSDGGKQLVDMTPEIQRELKAELARLNAQYGGKDGEDMTKFPSITFPDQKIDPVK
ncbi:ATP synthase-coupling factor 6, mitochondrial [Nilaparvata lugens]|uniref:ATP synthase-coupling factor 6, mitochondrial n=1 Tax=Nilaparvata lugens TaxID=108931 RepID=UPI00193D0DC0|nr:ATP synthase-coupling factor 6, mitochondrial [Nilaparvata lugens]